MKNEDISRYRESRERPQMDTIPFREIVATAEQRVGNVVDQIAAIKQDGRNPSKGELDDMKLRPWGYLVAAGEFRVFPGGAASPIAPEVARLDLEKTLASTQPGEKVNYLYLTHGALNANIPNQKDITGPDRMRNPRLDYDNIPTRDYVLRNVSGVGSLGDHVHEEMCCGVPGGQVDNTRELAYANLTSPELQRMRELAAQKGVELKVIVAEAIISLHSNTPQIRVFEEGQTHLDSEDRYREEHRDPLLYPVGKLESIGRFNERIQRMFDNGEKVRGIGCSDYRQGHSVPHEAVDRADLDVVIADYGKTQKTILGAPEGATTAWQGIGHTEAWAINVTGENRVAVANYVDALRNPGAMVRRRGVDIGGQWYNTTSPAGPFPISIPDGMQLSQDVIEGVAGLVGRLNASQYDRKLPRNPVTMYKQIEGKLVRVDIPRGLQVVDPDRLLAPVKPGKVIMASTYPTNEQTAPSQGDKDPDSIYSYKKAQGRGAVIPGTRRSWPYDREDK